MQLQPVLTFIISIFIIILVINSSALNGKIQKRRLLASFIDSFIWLIYCVMFNMFEFMDNSVLNVIVFIASIIVYAVFGFVLYFTYKNMALRNKHYNLFIDSIKNTRYNVYLVLDRKDNIKDISTSLLDELGLKYNDVSNENIYNVFDKTIRFTRYNGMDINNKSFKEYYKNYKFEVKKDYENKIEIVFQNYKGEAVTLNINEKPVFMFNSYKGRVLVGEKTSNDNYSLERQLDQKEKEIESFRLKFVTTLEISDECLFYHDMDEKYILGNDQFKEQFGFNDNIIAIDEYLSNMHPDDLNNYIHVIDSINIDNPKYSVSYRYKNKGEYVWVKESAKRIYEDTQANSIMGYVKIQTSIKQNNTSSNPLLDLVKTENELLNEMNKLYSNKRLFEIAIISVKNKENIKMKHGDEFCSMMLYEYVKKLKKNFLSETADIYNVSDDFALIITDIRKIDLLKRALTSDPNVMNLIVEYGAIKELIEVNMGISRAVDDAADSNSLLDCAKRALKASKSGGYAHNCLYYRDLK